VIAADDLVRRGDRWVRAAELPWIHGMALERKRDGRRLFWITLILMLLGLAGVLWIRSHAALVARKSGACRRAACGRAGQPMVDNSHADEGDLGRQGVRRPRRHGPRGDWSVSILSGEFDPVSLIRRPAVPVMIKLRAKTRWLAMDAGLRALKAQGKISDYTIDPAAAGGARRRGGGEGEARGEEGRRREGSRGRGRRRGVAVANAR